MEEWNIALPSLTWVLDGGERLDTLPGRFTPGEMVADTHYTGGLVGPTTALDAVECRKIS
jgi:hypothetical protein